MRSTICEFHQSLDLATVHREWHESNDRSPTRFFLNPQLAAELFQARPHSENAHAETLGLARGRHVRDAFSIVANAEKHAPSPLPEEALMLRRDLITLYRCRRPSAVVRSSPYE